MFGDLVSKLRKKLGKDSIFNRVEQMKEEIDEQVNEYYDDIVEIEQKQSELNEVKQEMKARVDSYVALKDKLENML